MLSTTAGCGIWQNPDPLAASKINQVLAIRHFKILNPDAYMIRLKDTKAYKISQNTNSAIKKGKHNRPIANCLFIIIFIIDLLMHNYELSTLN